MTAVTGSQSDLHSGGTLGVETCRESNTRGDPNPSLGPIRGGSAPNEAAFAKLEAMAANMYAVRATMLWRNPGK